MELVFKLALFTIFEVYCTGYSWQDVPSNMEGFWDNKDQIDKEIDNGVPPEDRHSQISAIFFRVDVPIFDENDFVCLYLQEYADGDPTLVYRQRLYVFDEYFEYKSNVFVRNQIFSLKEPERFLDGWDNPEIFEDLNENDLMLNEGCDLIWSVGDDYFYNNGTGTSCRAYINDRETIIDVSNEMKPKWLTVDYAFIDVETGDVIIGWPSPFNMTKLSDSPPSVSKSKAEITIMDNFPWIKTDMEKNLYEEVLAALIDGYEVDYAVNLTRCSTLDGEAPKTKLEIVAGPVETFEYFYGERFGPVPYWGSSIANIILTEEEVHRLRLTQIRFYANETVRVRIVLGKLDTSEFEEYDILYCTSSDGPGNKEVFTIHENQDKTQLTSYNDILNSLYQGQHIRYVSHYYSCGPIPAETIGGSVIHGFDINSSQDEIIFHGGEMIVNYFIEEDGFLYNGASGIIKKATGTTEFKPWGIEYGSWNVRYVSLYNCTVNDGIDEGGIYYYHL